MAAGLPHQNHADTTTDKLFRFRNNELGEMSYKLDSTENPLSFEKYPTPQKKNRDPHNFLKPRDKPRVTCF